MTVLAKEVSSFVVGDTLYEEIYKDGKPYFLGSDGVTFSPRLPTFRRDTIEYKPINDDLLEKGAVRLPSEPTEYGTFSDLLKEIYLHIRAYLDISDLHRKYATWYIVLTWVTDHLNTIPYLRARADYGSGKTRYLDVIGGLCYKPLSFGGAVRSAPIFRSIDKWKGTALFDEFNLEKSDESEEVIQILNNGYQKGKPILRCAGENNEVTAFDAFGPKIIATKKQFQDLALESRCITEILSETGRDDIPIELPPVFFEEQKILRNKLLMYRFRNWKIVGARPIIIDLGRVQPRIKQSMLPFAALFYDDPIEIEKFKLEVKERNDEIVRDNMMSLEGFIVRAYLIQAPLYPFLTVERIIDCIKGELDYEGRALTRKGIGSRLKSLGFKSESLYNPADKKMCRSLSISKGKLLSLMNKYVSEEPIAVEEHLPEEVEEGDDES